MRILLIMIMMIIINCQHKKDTCPNIKKFTYDEWDAKYQCPNPNYIKLTPQLKKCSRYEPNKEQTKRISIEEITEFREKMNQRKLGQLQFENDYESYKKKINQKIDL